MAFVSNMLFTLNKVIIVNIIKKIHLKHNWEKGTINTEQNVDFIIFLIAITTKRNILKYLYTLYLAPIVR